METRIPAEQVPPPRVQEKRRSLTLEALVDVDEGRTVDHGLMQTWADSLDDDRPLPLPRKEV
ncbi:hypothetical protein GGD57_001133 [Rhizobium esperanzae]|uniref:CopG family transcriptional regulator n=1 Tax=Rhizobium esperanzae TaxID=1967781 RepID=A0A7W6R1N3_9HYPH|nr:hypothetical protein [Rhizobium esperanzae]MBB4234577.1 hypothetical protein [Rhizobium esperanzae]